MGKVALIGNNVENMEINGKSYAAGSVSADTIGGVGIGTWSIIAKVTCAYVQ